MKRLSFRRPLTLLAVAALCLSQVTWALAGTTGGLSGQVTDDSGASVSGAAVKVSSASQTAETTTDAKGHFAFISLAPDTYTVAVEKNGYNPSSLAGITVFADQNQSLALKLSKALQTIAKVTSRAAGSLVKSGTTSDVYSVNSATATAVQGLGGGHNLDSAYSAIYSMPGVTSQIGNYGMGQVFYIRGSSYSQVGYEYDGIPVNRAFDNYNANSLSNLGSQETQVYTGGSPAGGSSATLAGYINQVIKTGSYPGYATFTGGIGTPTFYHKLSAEAGGATPDRRFSYYIGLSGINQDYRLFNNDNGGNLASDGSNPYGLNGFSINGGAAFAPLTSAGPWSTCTATDGPPKGAATFGGYPSCAAYSPLAGDNLGWATTTFDRENVVNMHWGIPHKDDGGRDDIQLLFYNYAYESLYDDSIDQAGGLTFLNNAYAGWGSLLGNSGYPGAGGPYSNLCAFEALATSIGCATTGSSPLPYMDSHIFAPGTQFGQSASTVTVNPYYAPGTPTDRALYSGMPTDLADTVWNDGSIIKLQYQKNFGSNAFARLLGYTFYSDWLQDSPNKAGYYGVVGYGYGSTGSGYPSPDYELATHSRGLQLDIEDQINSQHLLQFNVNYTTANALRWNNQYYSAPSGVTNLTNGTNCFNGVNAVTLANNPLGGGVTLVPGGALNSCLSSYTAGTYSNPTSTVPSVCAGTDSKGNPDVACTAATAPGAQYEVTVPGGYGTLNTVKPEFSSVSLQDTWQPTDRWNINLGVRYEDYKYVLSNTGTPDYTFWFNQAANSYCYDPATNQPLLITLSPGENPAYGGPQVLFNTLPGEDPGKCYSSTGAPVVNSKGQQYLHPNGVNGNILYTNLGVPTLDQSLFSPRIAATYTFNPDTVLRMSAGRYSQPTPTAYEQYANAAALGAAKSDFANFFALGFDTPVHDNPVQVSNNIDFSYERHFKGTDMTLKVSPFYRYTTNQLVTVSLGGNFASAINAATQKSDGVEVALQKGDPSRNGFAGQLSYTYTSALVKYSTLANGSNTIDTINNYIDAFNALTQKGGGSPFYCAGTGTGPNGSNQAVSSASVCNGLGGTPIQNPYYNMNPGSTLDRNGWYPAYANNPPYTAPDGVGDTAISPNVFAGFLNYKHNKASVNVSFQLNQGTAYGSPLATVGVDPRECTGNEAGAFKNGTSYVDLTGTQYANLPNYQTCPASTGFTPSGFIAIPNAQTGQFDGLATYREPWELNLGMQFGYDLTPRVHATLTLANIVNTCFGGSKEPWSQAYPANNYDCAYVPDGYGYVGGTPGAGYFYGASGHDPANGTAGYPAWMDQSYAPSFGFSSPFQAYLQLSIKL